MRIERARNTPGNLTAVHGLIAEASGWLGTKDTKQWQAPWPDKKQRDARIVQDLKAGRTWIVWDGETPAATLTTAEKPNPAVWKGSECDLDEPAIYAHRLVTARSHAGYGLGAQLIDWAGLRGHACYGAKWIRIDVWKDNAELQHYYKMTGFEPAGFCADLEYPSGALFQKEIAGIQDAGIPLVTGRWRWLSRSAEFSSRQVSSIAA